MDLAQQPLRVLVDKMVAQDIVLPDIQRDYVWSGAQIPKLLDSLYRQWPVGSVLLWRTTLSIPTKPAAIEVQGPAPVQPLILLDGQQRLSTLTRVMHPDLVPAKDKRPDVRFNPGTEEFKTANAVQKHDKRWISVSEILQDGAQFRDLVKPLDVDQATEDAYTDILAKVATRIRDYTVPVQTVDVDEYDTVAEIFNRVNTGGTRLSKGDLVLGSMAAKWSGGRSTIEEFEAELRVLGWKINREVLLRIVSVLAVGNPNHTRLIGLKTEAEWKQSFERATKAIRLAISFLRNDARIPVASLLPTEYVLLLPAVILDAWDNQLDPGDSEALARWVYLAAAFGHYSASIETVLTTDVRAVTEAESAQTNASTLEGLIAAAQAPRTAGAKLTAEDMGSKKATSPLFKLLRILAIQNGAKSWLSNLAITHDPLHNGLAVEVHHVFPKAWLKTQGIDSHPERDTMANFAFLSKWDNIKISAGDPSTYLAAADESALKAQWIPLDPDLWKAERFDDFCAARRALLAEALNEMLGLDAGESGEEPLEAETTPEPEVGSWAEEVAVIEETVA